MVRVIGVGDNTVDKYLHLRQMFPGGNSVNVPVLAHRYGHPASYIGWLGDDEAGQLMLAALNDEGIDTSRCRVIHGPNAASEVAIVNGDRVFGKADHGVARQIALDEQDLEFVQRHDVTHTSIYSHIERDLPRLREASAHLSFDFSQGWTREYLAEMLPLTTIAFLSAPDEARDGAEDVLRWAAAQGPAVVVVTRGSAGALAYDGRRVYDQGIIEVSIVDTLGAGDAFAARFLVEYIGGAPVQDALAAAAQSAAETCGYFGAFGHGKPF